MDLNPAAIMAAHSPAPFYCIVCSDPDGFAVEGPCLPYRLAEALAASEAKVAHLEKVRATVEGETFTEICPHGVPTHRGVTVRWCHQCDGRSPSP